MRTIKKTLSVLLACVMLFTVVPAFNALAAGDLIEGTHVRWSYNSDTKTLTFTGYGPMPDYTQAEMPPLPRVPWLEEGKEAETLVIGNGITTIGSCCTMFMPALRRAVLPESLVRIGAYNFYACKNLTELELPAGLLDIGKGSFLFCGLTHVEIPAGVKTLDTCFDYMLWLEDVTLHEGLQSIRNSFSLTKLQSLTVPASVRSVTECSFVGLKTLVNLSDAAVAHEQMDSYAEPADMELYYYAMELECDLYIDYYLDQFTEAQTSEDWQAMIEDTEERMIEAVRLWLNENRGTSLETLQETVDYLSERFNLTGAPAPDAAVYCITGSAEDRALDKTSITHYLIDRDNALCERPPVYNGSAGANITWRMDAATGTLTFTGYGETDEDLTTAAYHLLADEITSVAFECTDGPITRIGDGAFSGLTNLTSLTIPAGVERLGLRLITDSGVRELTITDVPTDFYSNTLLLGTAPLQRIVLAGESERYFTDHGALYENYGDGTCGLYKLPAEAAGYPLHENVKNIEYYAVEGLTELTEFTVPGTVSYVSSYAFCDLPALETVYIEPGEDRLRTGFSENAFYGSTSIAAFRVEDDDPRYFVRDGILFDKTNMFVSIVPGQTSSLDLAEDIKGIRNYALRWERTLDRMTVRADDFNFFGDTYASRSSALHFTDENTVIACRKGSAAETYALRFGCPVEYFEGVTVSEIAFITDGPLTTPQYEKCTFKELGIRAEVRYSDGDVTTIPSEDLWYYLTFDNIGSTSERQFNELGEYELTVSLGGASQTFTLTVVPNRLTYRIDASAMRTDYAVWENVSTSKAVIWCVDPDTGAETEVQYYSPSMYYWDGTDWIPAGGHNGNRPMTSSPGEYRVKLEYRGFAQELTVNVSEDDVRFTTNAAEAVTEIPQFAHYDKEFGNNRLFVTHGGETEDITDKLVISADTAAEYGYVPSLFDYSFHYLDTTVLGDATVWLCADYSFYESGRGHRRFSVTMPLEVQVVPGDVTDAYLDISGVPATLPTKTRFTAGELGIRLVKTMADGSTQIDEDPAGYFHWVYMPSTYSGPTLDTPYGSTELYVRFHHGGLMAYFTVRVHSHSLTFVPAASGVNCCLGGNVAHWHCSSCGKNYADEEAETELADISDGVYGPHAPGALHTGFAATCTEDGLMDYCVCAVCGRLTDEQGNLLADPLLPAGHVYGEWIAEIAPSCIDPGIKGHYTCALCGVDFDENKAPLADLSIAATGHTPGTAVRENVIAATCTAAGGYDEVVYCVYCPAELSRKHVETAATDHAWGEWEVIKQATVNEEGLMRRVCKNDPGHVEEEVIPKLQPQTSAFQRFIERIREFFNNIMDWFRKLFRF